MKTLTPASARPSTAPIARLRRLAVVGIAIPVLALAACSGEDPVTANPTVSTPTGTTPGTSTTTTTTVPTTTTATTPAQFSTKNIKAVIKDPELGHTITALKISRNLPFPTNQPVGAEAFEIVGVKIEFEAGSRYSAALEPSMLSLIAADPKQDVAPTAEFGAAYKADPLTTAKRDKTERGWVFFKVDRGTTTALKLAYHRPAYEVSTTDKNIKAKTFTVVLTK